MYGNNSLWKLVKRVKREKRDFNGDGLVFPIIQDA